MTKRRQPGPLVAAVVTVFNKAPFVADTLRSLVSQTYEDIELVVVDDGSTDGSPELVRRALEGLAVRIIGLANGGVSRARNVGAAETSDRAKYLLFLDADDLLAPDAVASLVAHLERHPEATACYSRLHYIDKDGSQPPEVRSDVRWAQTPFGRRRIPEDLSVTPLEAIWARYCAIPSCCLIRRSAFAATQGWDTALCPPAAIFGAEDKDMVIQLALHGEIHRVPQRLVTYRVMPNSRSDALYTGLKALNVKWWSADLNPDARTRVRRAIRFDFRVAALDEMNAFVKTALHPNTGDLRASGSRALRASIRCVLTGPLMNHWSREMSTILKRRVDSVSSDVGLSISELSKMRP
jgi:glycosyltransferase involved in cell wall biosynthesis